jgi:putative mafB1
MFPDNWTENRIKVEIDNVLKNPNNRIEENVWQGTTSTDVKIEVIYREGKVITAYPIKP